MKIIAFNLIAFLLSFSANAQQNIHSSEQEYTTILTNGDVKSWYSVPAIINVPSHVRYYKIEFKLSPRSLSWRRMGGRSRNMFGQDYKKYLNWKIAKDGDGRMILIVSDKEKYYLELIEKDGELILNIVPTSFNMSRRGISGKYYEQNWVNNHFPSRRS